MNPLQRLLAKSSEAQYPPLKETHCDKRSTMDPLDLLLSKTPKASFLLKNHSTKDYVVVDDDFAKSNKVELTELWNLVDSDKNQNFVAFQYDRSKYRITTGWEELRRTYKVVDNDRITFRFLGNFEGNSAFKISVLRGLPLPNKKHNQTPQKCIAMGPPKLEEHGDVSWQVTLTKYKATGSQLCLPRQITDKYWEKNFECVLLCFNYGYYYPVKLLKRQQPRKTIKFGLGWKEVCANESLKQGDTLKFTMDDSNNIVYVNKN